MLLFFFLIDLLQEQQRLRAVCLVFCEPLFLPFLFFCFDISMYD